ncbi:MAG: hypothetical protein O2944_05840 [Proteobacteria bacterium]|nr:hypothetical protein [Pseudomonadota bacterium]
MRKVLTALLIFCFVALPVTMAVAMPGTAAMAAAEHHHGGDGDCDDAKMGMCCQMSATHCGGVFQFSETDLVIGRPLVRTKVTAALVGALRRLSTPTELRPPRV